MAITWRRTFEGRAHDFSADDDGVLVGRIYRERGGPSAGKWYWFVNGIHASSATVGCDLRGGADTKQDAADRVKAAWAQWLTVRLAANESAK